MATIDVDGGPKKTETAADAAIPTQANAPKLDLDVTRDTVTRGDKTSGLGRVFVQMDANALADDVADLALWALKTAHRAGPWRIRVVDDPAALRGTDTLALLTHRATALNAALDVAIGPPAAEVRERLQGFAAAGPIAGVALQGAGILGKLFARDYQLSGREVPTDGLGFDLHVAQKLAFKHPNGVVVRAERVMATDIAGSAIFGQIAALDERARTGLTPRLTKAASDLAAQKAMLAAKTAARDALNAQAVELAKVLGVHDRVATELATTRTAIATIADDIAAIDVPAAQATYDALAALAAEITAFVTTATTPADGGRAPLLDAARAESLVEGECILYAKLLTGGMDENVDSGIIRKDTWTGLTGATAEFALVDGSVLLASGVRSALQTTTVELAHPDRVKQHRVAYADVPQFEP